MAHRMDPIRIKPGRLGRLDVYLPYTEIRYRRIQTIPGHKWNPEKQCWTVPDNARMVQRLRALYSGDQVEVDPSLLAPLPKHPGQRSALKTAPGEASETVHAVEIELQKQGRSHQTVKIYTTHIKRLLNHIPKAPGDLRPEEVRAYLKDMETQQNISRSYYTQAVSALKFLYKHVLKQPDPTATKQKKQTQ
ncbi:MAG: phage integrase N-terminal SAM-like domain-containing protein [bacterium]|nr:phage integrase N-terminal SAM-like domain-containing protein [bacterium]